MGADREVEIVFVDTIAYPVVFVVGFKVV